MTALHGKNLTTKTTQMKKILISILLLASINAFSQSANDSAWTKNLAIQARLTAIFSPQTTNTSNDSLIAVFIKWRQAQHQNFVTGTTTITIDSIPTVELANLYNYVMGLSGGLGFMPLLNQLNAARTANPYLDRLCSTYDQQWSLRASQMLLDGYKLQRGR